MSEQKLHHTADSATKNTASGSSVRSEHHRSMPDMSASTSLKSKMSQPTNIGHTENEELALSSLKFSFTGSEPPFTSTPLPQEGSKFDFENTIKKNSSRNLHGTGSSNVDPRLPEVSGHQLLERISSDKTLMDNVMPLKTADSLGQFVKPTDILKKRLQSSNGRENSSSSELSADSSTINGGTTVIKYDEKVFKEVVESKLKEHNPIDKEDSVGSNSKILNSFFKTVGNPDFTRRRSDTDAYESLKTDERKTQSEKALGYGSHHDFTSIVEFLEVLKDREKQQAGKSDPGFEKIVSSETLESPKLSDNKMTAESPRGKYAPAVPSPLTYSTSSGEQEIDIDQDGDTDASPSYNEHADRSRNPSVLSQMVGNVENVVQRSSIGIVSADSNVTERLGSVENVGRRSSTGMLSSTPSNVSERLGSVENVGRKGSTGTISSTHSNVSQKLGSTENVRPLSSTRIVSSMPSNVTESRTGRQSSGYSGLGSPSPSKLLQKVERREQREKKGEHGYGELDYTTPSKLLEKVETRESRERKASNGNEQFEYTTPSQLLAKVERGEQKPTPGYGEFDYANPSELFKKRRRIENQRQTSSYDNQSASTSRQELMLQQSLDEMDYPTVSQLLVKVLSREMRAKSASPMSHESLDQRRSSDLRDGSLSNSSSLSGFGDSRTSLQASQAEKKQHENKRLADRPAKKGLRRSKESDGQSSYNSERVLMCQNIPSGSQDGSRSSLQYVTSKNEMALDRIPSQLLEKVEKRERIQQVVSKDSVTEQNLPPTVSKLHDLVQKREKRERLKMEKIAAEKCGTSLPEYTTPSQLLAQVEKREARARGKDSQGYGMFEYTTPSKLGNAVSSTGSLRQKSSSSHVHDFVGMETRSPTISEVFDAVRKGTYHPPHSQNLGSNISRQSSASSHMSLGTLLPTSSELQEIVKNEQFQQPNQHLEVTLSNPYSNMGDSKSGIVGKKLGYNHSDITAYFPTQDEPFYGLPSRRHYSNPEFFGSFYEDDSNVGLTDGQNTSGTHTLRSSDNNLSSFMLNDSRVRNVSQQTSHKSLVNKLVQTGRSLTTNPSYQAISPQESLQNLDSGCYIGQTSPRASLQVGNTPQISLQDLGSGSYIGQTSPRASSQVGNTPQISLQDLGSGSYIGQTSPRASSQMENPLNDTASLNQLFWSLYASHPEVMEQYLEHESQRPSEAALSSLHDLYTNALQYMGDDSSDMQETLRFSSSSHKKRVLPHSPTSSSPDARSFFMEKEVLESQNRKLQMEISTLQTENKLLKEKYNRATGKIDELEDELRETKSELESSQLSLNQEVSSVQRKSKSDAAQDMEQLQSKVINLVQENENLKAEILHLESKLQATSSIVDLARQSGEKQETMEAYRMEVTTLKGEVIRLKSLLEQCEKHLHDEECRLSESNHQVLKLTELKNLLQHQVDMSGGGNTVVDKQIKSLEKRLKVTEERLHQERSDRANNLSEVEDKLLTENARLQGTEKELCRQLQREKDKNCNLEQKIKDVRNENEKLRLQVPFDELTLSSEKYDIPYSSHISQRQEATKNHDYKYICAQLESQSGLTTSEKDMICHLWSTKEQACHQLQKLEILLEDLSLHDNDVYEGLKNLRDMKHQYEQKLKQAEEQADDAKSEKFTFEATYKEQLATLVKERHEAFAQLKTAEDLLEATRSENEILRQNLPALSTGAVQSLRGKDSEKESLNIQVQSLESKVQALSRSNQVMEGEISTLKTQMEAREKALKDVESELELANSQLELDKGDDRKQQKMDKLVAQVNSQEAEIGLLNDKYNRLLVDYRSLENELDATQSELARVKQKGVKAGEIADSKLASSLKEEIDDKNQQMNQLAQELEKLDNELQQSRQDLYIEQIQSNEYEGQIESLQQQFEERGKMIDAITETEKEQLAQYQVLKATLDSVTAELKDKEAKIKILTIEQSQTNDKLQQYERKLSVYTGDPREITPPSVAEVELEKEQIKMELLDAYNKQKASEEEMQTMATELHQLQQDVTSQKAEILQMSSEKGELEQHLEEIAEEHDALIQEKAQSEEDTVKLENKLQELVETLESEARKQYGNFGEDTSPEFSEEMDTLKSLLTSKDKEIEMLQIKTSRQQMDLEFLQRRIELLHNDNQSNRDDIARMTNQLINKMKEGVECRQLNEYLVGERSRIQNEMSEVEKDVMNARQMQQIKMTETEKAEFNKKDMIITTIEGNLDKVRKNLQEAEYENVQLRYKVEGLVDDQKKLTTLNSSLENKLEAERKINDYQIYSTQNENLRQEVRDIQTELNECQKQLTASEEALKNAKQDKGIMYHEYENMVKRLSEKDHQIIELQTKLEVAISEKEKELHMQQHALQLEKTSTERELDMTKTQVLSLSSEMKQKDDELSTFGKTLHELEETNRRKSELERELGESKIVVHDMKTLLESHKKEILSLKEAISNYQEAISKVQLEKAGVEDKLHRLDESTSVQIHDLTKTVEGLRSANDGEKFYLKDNLNQTKSELQSIQSSLSSAVQTRDKLTAENLLLKRTVEETREQLQEETTARKVAGQKAGSLESQLHESRKERFLTEEKLNKSQDTVSKLEKELKFEKEKLKTAVERSQEFEASAYSKECTANAKQEQVDLLQNEVSKLKQILESQKIQMNSKLKRNANDMSQQIELIDMDRNKLSHQNKQLFADLESSRETVQMKNKENLKLHEQILQLQEEANEMKFKYKASEESRKTEEELYTKLQQKVQDQEEELKRVRTFLTRKAEESGGAEKSAWHEMNKMIQDMSKQMSQHLESQRVYDKDSKDRDSKVIQRYKKQIHDLNTELQTERALHKITATSLQSLEEDCVRLRQQCQAMRRRNNSASDKKYKSRMEAINEIIARSQSQAQAMLSSGNYLDDTIKSLGSPRVTFNESPDNSICSDMSFNSTVAVLDNESSPPKPTQRSTPKS